MLLFNNYCNYIILFDASQCKIKICIIEKAHDKCAFLSQNHTARKIGRLKEKSVIANGLKF